VLTSVSIGDHSIETMHKFPVVVNSCAPLVLGLDLIRSKRLRIDPDQKRALTFRKGVFKTGMRPVEAVVLRKRSVSIVQAEVQTDATLIATVPFTFDPNLMVANSINQVNNGKISVAILNSDDRDVLVKRGQQIACFEVISEPENRHPASRSVNALLALEQTDEVVEIGDNLDEEQVSNLRELFVRNKDAFAARGKIGFTTSEEHHIVMTENQTFIEKARRHPPQHVQEAKRQVKEMLEERIVEPSVSPWCSEYVLVKKKTNDWPLCIDFRRLNSVIKRDSFPLPNAEECLEQLSGNQFFSSLDFAGGCWRLPVTEDGRGMTAFRVDGEVYQFVRMPFGLKHPPATFQRLITALFAGLKGLNLQFFLDDICIASTTWREHLVFLEAVLRKIIHAGLRLKPSKCKFGDDHIIFLRHLLTRTGIRPDPEKLLTFTALPAPTDASGVKRVLGAFGYYQSFIKNFAALVDPLVQSTRKGVAFRWGPAEQSALDAMKAALNASVTLVHINATDPVVLITDASIVGIAGILLQLQEMYWRLITCVSRCLTKAEKNYSPIELEGLAIVYSLSKLRHSLLGRKFKIYTNHCALCVLNHKSTQNARVARCAIALSEYDFDILHVKGKCHEDVDCLSRAPVKSGEDEFLENSLSIREKPNVMGGLRVLPVDVDV